MSILPNLLRSILLASIFGFTAPVLTVGSIWGSLMLLSGVPSLAVLSPLAMAIGSFLAVFGSGDAIWGLLVIGLVCSLVGVLFDTYTFYRHQNSRDS
jgi:H+/gluconate symporter-like permease